MREGWWGAIAFLLGALAFGQIVLLDTTELPLHAGGGAALLWVGAVLAAVLGALAFSRLRPVGARRWAIGGGAAVAGFLVAFVAFQAVLLAGMSGAHSQELFVERSEGEPVASLDPNETYERVPNLAEALDELVRENRSQVFVTNEQAVIDEIEAYLVEQTEDYVDPFTWRGETVRVSLERA